MFENQIQPFITNPNLAHYEEACKSFTWDDVNAEFTWASTNRINIAHEAIDRYAALPAKADQPCLTFADHDSVRTLTFKQMSVASNKFGNVLLNLGVRKGDRVFLFMPRIPEMYIAMAGCAKIGAVIALLYSDYREGAVKERMLDGQGKVLVTTVRHRARVPAEEIPELERLVIVGAEQASLDEYEITWDAAMDSASDQLALEWVDSEHPLFLTYTSGYDGRPVGLIHPHDAMRGYFITAKWVLDLKDGDVLWTLARPGWLMNVVYSAFAPWLCGIESFVTGKMHDAEQIYRHVEQHNVSVMYAIPTIYTKMKYGGEETAAKFKLDSLRHMLSALEPLYPETIYAVLRIFGITIHDTWWTAETGMITIANLPCIPVKPGYLGKLLPGFHAIIFDSDGNDASPFTMGQLALKTGWPSMARGVWGNEEIYNRYIQNKPWFMSGDTVFKDFDNYFYYQGRVDDVIITPTGRIGISEIESIIEMHPAVAEAGVIRHVDKDNTRRIKAFVSLKPPYKPSDLLKRKIIAYVHNNLSPDTVPKDIEFCDNLPKAQDGHLLRRVLKAWELGLPTGNIASLS